MYYTSEHSGHSGAFQVELECSCSWSVGQGGKPEKMEKTSRSREENQQQTKAQYAWRWVRESNPGSYRWGASALTTTPSLLPHVSTEPSLFPRSANRRSILQRNSSILRSSNYYLYVWSHLKFWQERSRGALWGIYSSYLIYDVVISLLGREITALWNEYCVKSCGGGCWRCIYVVDIWSM